MDAQRKLYDPLTGPKTPMRFTAADLAGEHSQMGAIALSNQQILDWLNETLASFPSHDLPAKGG